VDVVSFSQSLYNSVMGSDRSNRIFGGSIFTSGLTGARQLTMCLYRKSQQVRNTKILYEKAEFRSKNMQDFSSFVTDHLFLSLAVII